MTSNEIIAIVTTLVTLFNTGAIIYFSWVKLKPEVKHMELEADTEMVDAAKLNLEGAKISGEMLLQRINDLKAELELEKKSRREDAEYFRRRIRDLERESRDYRSWAAKLVRQVIDVGLSPVPFEPNLLDTDPTITTLKPNVKQ